MLFLIFQKGRAALEQAIPNEHKKLISYICKQEKLSKKKKEEKRNERKKFIEDMIQEKAMKAEQEEADEFEENDIEAPIQMEDTMELENNNLLLKFDTMVRKISNILK